MSGSGRCSEAILPSSARRATIQPIRAPLGELAVAATFGMVTVLLVLPRGSMLSRMRGLALLAAYARARSCQRNSARRRYDGGTYADLLPGTPMNSPDQSALAYLEHLSQ